MSAPRHAVLAALAAAALFGASTPLAKQLMGDGLSLSGAFLLAGLLYLGSGLGLGAARLWRDGGWRAVEMPRSEWPWLLAAIAFGGVLGPLLLMLGLSHTGAATASLLLNLESVLTALLAWLVFREHTDRRMVLGMLLIAAGGLVLAWPASGGSAAQGASPSAPWLGPLAIALACLAWATDNNLTRKVSANDALFIAGSKGLIAGGVNTGIALAMGASLPAAPALAQTLVIGFFGYGLSLVLFVLALRGLGAARSGAYFSTAPFVGAALSIALFNEATSTAFWVAPVLMAAGVWLHLQERHNHEHEHAELAHTHQHTHDEHHRHSHGFEWDMAKAHSHAHRHEPLKHAHPHYPDIHHQHPHR